MIAQQPMTVEAELYNAETPHLVRLVSAGLT
jgi:hypothetical protein